MRSSLVKDLMPATLHTSGPRDERFGAREAEALARAADDGGRAARLRVHGFDLPGSATRRGGDDVGDGNGLGYEHGV